MKQKKLMLLGGIRYLLPVIKAAHKLGAYVITADYLPNNIAHKYSDEYVNVSIIDREAVLKVAQEKQIDGILSFGVDPGVVTAAYVADKMGLAFPPLESVEILQNKDKFRDFLLANGFNCPWHKGYASKEEAMREWRSGGVGSGGVERGGVRSGGVVRGGVGKFPVIVKPVDSAGSKGCRRVDSFDELSDAIDSAISESHNGRFIIEQFLERVGHSSDTDCFSIDDELVYCSFDCQYFDAKANNPYTPSGYSWPSDMSAVSQRELRGELARLVKLLHMGTSIYNVETRVAFDGKPYIMEFTPRGGGNRLSEILGMAAGQDLISNCVRAALRLPVVPMTDPVYDGHWAEVIVHSNKGGKYAGLQMPPEFKAAHVVQEDMWVKPGDTVEEFTGANKTIGTLVLRFDTHAEAERALDTVDEWLKVEVS